MSLREGQKGNMFLVGETDHYSTYSWNMMYSIQVDKKINQLRFSRHYSRTAAGPQLTTLYSTGNISVWTKEVGHSNTRETVRLCSFPLKFTAAQ